MSFGGRISSIKSVLGNLPIYYLSLFKMPVCVMNELVKIQSRFLLGGLRIEEKTAFGDWSKVNGSKERGGVGIKNLKWMNVCLLMKWWWRFGTKRKALWRGYLLQVQT